MAIELIENAQGYFANLLDRFLSKSIFVGIFRLSRHLCKKNIYPTRERFGSKHGKVEWLKA